MVKAHVERVIEVPVERAWEILADFSHVHKIHPLVGKVDQVTPNKDRGVGAIRTCHFYDGNKATERIEEWDEDRHTYLVRLIDGTLPVKTVLAKFTVEDAGNGKSLLLGDMDLKAKYGLLGKIMERLVIKPQLGGALGNVFAGVEEYALTGREIQKGYKSKTPAIVV